MDDLRKAIEAKIGELQDEAFSYNDALARAPELSGREYASSTAAVEILKKHGFAVEYPFAGLPTAFRGVRKNGGGDAKVALLMEYDALPGVGHACGHCASGAMSLLAGIALAALPGLWEGELHVIGTPDEEVGGGKISMAERGVFDGYDFAMMIHLSAVDTEVWPSFMALSNIRMKFHGQAAHAAAEPWNGCNALNGATLAMHAIDMLRQHVTPDVRLHGILTKGGEAANIIPDYAEIDFYVRGDDIRTVDAVEARVRNCAAGAATATETAVDFERPTPTLFDLRGNERARGMLAEIFDELGVPVVPPGESSFHGSSDIGHTSVRCPTAHPMLGVLGSRAALHSKEFAERMTCDEARRGIVTGADVIALAAARVLRTPALRRAIREDFERE